MADEQKSFGDLLNEAPLAADDVVSVVGTLARSHEPGKFVITRGDGQSLTFEIDAVKNHTILGGAVGQSIVKVDIDPNRVPADLQKTVAQKLPTHDPVKSPVIDKILSDTKVPYLEPIHTGISDIAGPGQVPLGGDPWGGFGAGASLTPFSLATPHQVAAMQIAVLQGGYRRGLTLPWPFGWGGNDPIFPKVQTDPM